MSTDCGFAMTSYGTLRCNAPEGHTGLHSHTLVPMQGPVESTLAELARLRAVNGQLLAAAEEGLSALERAANGGLAYKITRNQLRAAIAEAQKATGGQ